MSRILRLCAALAAASALACSGGGSPVPVPAAFEVTHVSPGDNDSGVGLRADIRILFSRPVDDASLDDESVKVVTDAGKDVFGKRSVSPLTPTTVSFVPNAEYAGATNHRVLISTALKDKSGHALARAHESRFRTMAPPPSLPGQALVEDLGNALAGGRWFHSATLLPAGGILVAGGYVATSTTQGLVEVLNPATGRSTIQPGRLVQPRARHAQILLDDGRVLIAGGETDDVAFNPLLTAEAWNVQSGTSTAVAPMQFARSAPTATKLPDGRILVAGGMSLEGTTFLFRDDAEIYDPVANLWTLVPGTMSRGRSGHGAWVLSDGDVLVMGGTSAAPSADRLDLATGQFGSAGSLPASTHLFGSFATLPDGRAIYLGGFGTKAITIYDEQFGFLASLNPMQSERTFSTATALGDGRVVVVGGVDFGTFPELLHETIDLFVPEDLTGRVYRVPNLRLPVPTSHHAALLDNARDLWILGGLPTDADEAGLRRVTVLRLSQE